MQSNYSLSPGEGGYCVATFRQSICKELATSRQPGGKERELFEPFRRMKEAVTSIRFNIDQPLSLKHIADTPGVHPSYLSRAFKKALGMSLTDYINKLRIEVTTSSRPMAIDENLTK